METSSNFSAFDVPGTRRGEEHDEQWDLRAKGQGTPAPTPASSRNIHDLAIDSHVLELHPRIRNVSVLQPAKFKAAV